MKRTKNLIILLAVLVLAIGAYAVASAIAKREEDKNIIPEETKITIADKETADISSVSVTNKNSSYTIEFLSNKFFLKDDHAFPLDQSKATSIVNAASVVECNRIVAENGGSSAEYGLDDPKYLVLISYSDGTELSLKIGDYNQHTDSNYLSLDGEDRVYMIDQSFASSFGIPKYGLILNETVTEPKEKFESLTEINISFSDAKGHKYTLTEGEPAESGEDGSEDTWSLTLADGTAIQGDFSDKAKDVYNELFALELTDWADYNVTEETELQKYGLKTPYAEITVVYNETVVISGSDGTTSTVTKLVEKKLSLVLGDKLPDSENSDGAEETTLSESENSTSDEKKTERYFKLGDGKIVYIVSEDSFSEILSPANEK